MEKATIFITRSVQNERELLLIQHPHAGIQIPAGTVEPGENPRDAAIREMQEETGIHYAGGLVLLNTSITRLTENEGYITKTTPVYTQPDLLSSNSATLRRGLQVYYTGRVENGFYQVRYEEYNRLEKPNYITMAIIGWVPGGVLTQKVKRYFFHNIHTSPTPPTWHQQADHHSFKLFWENIHQLPPIVPPQDTWLEYLPIEESNNG